MSKPSFIYVIGREEGPVKVGITSSPGARLSAIQTGCPFPVKLHHCVLMRDRDHALLHERTFHEVYKADRLAGEWFNLDADLAREGLDTALEYQAHFEAEARRGMN